MSLSTFRTWLHDKWEERMMVVGANEDVKARQEVEGEDEEGC